MRRPRSVSLPVSTATSAARIGQARRRVSCSRIGGPSPPHRRLKVAYMAASFGSVRRSPSAIPSRIRCWAAGKLIVNSKLSYLHADSYPGRAAQTRSRRQITRAAKRRAANSGGLPSVHMQADRRAKLARPDLRQVTNLVDEPQPVTAGKIAVRSAVPGHRIGDTAGVFKLAEHFGIGGPQPDNAGAVGVPERVGGDLAGRYHQIGAPSW